MISFDPYRWYWLADDGRLFAAARMAIVDVYDAAYVTWAQDGGDPSAWPRDDAGEQTVASLQEVLRRYGLWVDLDALKTGLKAEIDAAAERERLKYITPGAGQAMTYSRKVEQAKAVLAAADPQPADYPMFAASLGLDGADIVAVANIVVAMDAAWETIGAAIETARLNAKAAVDQAGTAEAAKAVAVIWPS